MGAVIGSTTGIFTWNPGEAQGPESYTFDVCVSDSNLDDCETITVMVGEMNAAPVLEPIGGQTVNELTELSFTATATDEDLPENTLTYSLIDAPVEAAIGSSTGVFTWTPAEADGPADYTFSVCVSDGNLEDCESINVTVNEVNAAPVVIEIDDMSVAEQTALNFTALATDVDLPVNTLAFNLVGAPSGASITGGGVFTWTPTEIEGPGGYTFDVCVTDGNLGDCETITVTVNEVNTAPLLNAIGSQTIDELAQLSFAATATDADLPANALTFTLSDIALTGAAITADGVFTWTPTEGQGPGSYMFDVCVSDGALSDCETIEVTVNEVNAAPVLAFIDDRTINEHAALTFTATAADSDIPANTLIFSLSGAPEGASITTAGAFAWTPAESQGPGDYIFRICVSDGQSIDCQPVMVIVHEVNAAPELDPIGNQSIAEETLLSFTATANDVDLPENTLTFSLSNAPAGALIDALNGVFTWTPTEAQGPGSYSFDVCVSDGPLNDCETIAVSVGEVNVAPVLGAIGSQTVKWGRPLTFTAAATDADLPANLLTFSLVSAPAGASIDAQSGIFTWTPTREQVGPHSFTVRVTDNGTPNLYDEEIITITVTKRTTTLTYTGAISGQYSDGITLSASVTDQFGEVVSAFPVAFSIGAQNASAMLTNGAASALLTLDQIAGAYNVISQFEANSYYEAASDSEGFNILVENARVEFSSSNPVAVQVASAGGASGPFSLSLMIKERELTLVNAHPGNIGNAQVSMILSPVGAGSPVSGSCAKGTVDGTGYDAALPVTCSFNAVPVETYSVLVTVSGGYYGGTGEDVVVIFDPSLGFTTGGGWFYWPGTANPITGYPGDKTNFGYTMKYNKKGTNVQGSLLMIRHMPDDTIYRVKSNAIYGLALGENLNVPMGYASFSGKSTYQEPGWAEPAGNYVFKVYVEDRNQPGTGTDRFWIQVTNGLSMQDPAASNAVPISGGNIYAPHRAR